MRYRIPQKPYRYAGIGTDKGGIPTIDKVDVRGIVAVEDGFVNTDIDTSIPDLKVFFMCYLSWSDPNMKPSMFGTKDLFATDDDGVLIATDGEKWFPILAEHSEYVGEAYSQSFTPLSKKLTWGDQEKIKCIIQMHVNNIVPPPEPGEDDA